MEKLKRGFPFFCLVLAFLGGVIWIEHQSLAGDVVQTVTVKNSKPHITRMEIADAPEGNSVQSLDLRQGATTTIYVRGYVTDPTSCIDVDLPSDWKIVAYRSDLPEKENCSSNPENCYQVNEQDDLLLSGCDSFSDTTIEFIAPVIFEYVADSTTKGSPFLDSDWSLFIQVTDETGSATTQKVEHFEIESLLAFFVTPAVDYGTLTKGETSSPQEVSFTNLGNIDIFVDHSYLSDFQCSGSGSSPIPASHVTMTLDSPGGHVMNEAFMLLKKTADQSGNRILFFTLKVPDAGVQGVCNNVISFKALAKNK